MRGMGHIGEARDPGIRNPLKRAPLRGGRAETADRGQYTRQPPPYPPGCRHKGRAGEGPDIEPETLRSELSEARSLWDSLLDLRAACAEKGPELLPESASFLLTRQPTEPSR